MGEDNRLPDHGPPAPAQRTARPLFDGGGERRVVELVDGGGHHHRVYPWADAAARLEVQREGGRGQALPPPLWRATPFRSRTKRFVRVDPLKNETGNTAVLQLLKCVELGLIKLKPLFTPFLLDVPGNAQCTW